MSLYELNAPHLVASLSIGCYALLPLMRTAFQSEALSFTLVKVANLLAYGLSVYSVMQPGRYDGSSDVQYHGHLVEDGARKMSTGRNGLTLFPPAGWAFAIWGPIFLGECIMVHGQFAMMKESSALVPIIREITGPYITAQIFQTLWTASFRPRYNRAELGGFYKYVSVLSLAGAAYALSFCHAAFTSTNINYTHVEYWLYFFPLTLHFGWVTAASLVNLNGMFVMGKEVSPKSVALLSHISVIVASAIGVYVSFTRWAPFYGAVITWALLAVAFGLEDRLNETRKDDSNGIGVYGIEVQRALCLIGAFGNLVVSIVLMFQKFN